MENASGADLLSAQASLDAAREASATYHVANQEGKLIRRPPLADIRLPFSDSLDCCLMLSFRLICGERQGNHIFHNPIFPSATKGWRAFSPAATIRVCC